MHSYTLEDNLMKITIGIEILIPQKINEYLSMTLLGKKLYENILFHNILPVTHLF